MQGQKYRIQGFKDPRGQGERAEGRGRVSGVGCQGTGLAIKGLRENRKEEIGKGEGQVVQPELFKVRQANCKLVLCCGKP